MVSKLHQLRHLNSIAVFYNFAGQKRNKILWLTCSCIRTEESSNFLSWMGNLLQILSKIIDKSKMWSDATFFCFRRACKRVEVYNLWKIKVIFVYTVLLLLLDLMERVQTHFYCLF
jgi:hypothetical protein